MCVGSDQNPERTEGFPCACVRACTQEAHPRVPPSSPRSTAASTRGCAMAAVVVRKATHSFYHPAFTPSLSWQITATRRNTRNTRLPFPAGSEDQNDRVYADTPTMRAAAANHLAKGCDGLYIHVSPNLLFPKPFRSMGKWSGLFSCKI